MRGPQKAAESGTGNLVMTEGRRQSPLRDAPEDQQGIEHAYGGWVDLIAVGEDMAYSDRATCRRMRGFYRYLVEGF